MSDNQDRPEMFVDVRTHPGGGVSIRHVDGGPWMYYAHERFAVFWLRRAAEEALERLSRLVAR